MPKPQTLREILEIELKNLEEKEKRANDLEIEAKKIKAEVEKKRQKLILALGLDTKEKKVALPTPAPTLRDNVLSAVKELGGHGQFTFYDVIESLKKLPSAYRVKINRQTRFSVRGILVHLVETKMLTSQRTGNHNTYTLQGEDICISSPKAGFRGINTLTRRVFLAINELEKSGSKVTTGSIRNLLVDSGNYTYETLTRRSVGNKIFNLIKRGLVVIKTKIKGLGTSYQYTEAGKKLLESSK